MFIDIIYLYDMYIYKRLKAFFQTLSHSLSVWKVKLLHFLIKHHMKFKN